MANQSEKKPQVIVMTDGEVDDHSSMIRFLLYPCDLDVKAIIETNSKWQREGHSEEDWWKNMLDAYENTHPQLMVHNTDYPSADYLRSISFVGDEDPDHLELPVRITIRARRNIVRIATNRFMSRFGEVAIKRPSKRNQTASPAK